MKRYLSGIIIVLMIITMIPSYVIATVEDDITGHWAEETITKWKQKGLMTGYLDGTFKPDNNITKAEFISIINRIYGYYEKADKNYRDIKDEDWYYKETIIAKANKYMDWYKKEELKPNEEITRQEVHAILATIQQQEATEQPEEKMTRAEVVTMLDRIVGELINISGIYGPEKEEKVIEGNLTINTEGVILKNTIINGNLILAAGIKQGDITLENVTVKGKTIVNGGGENSLTLKNCSLHELIVFKQDGKIRIVSIDSEIGKTILLNGGKLQGDFKLITIIDKGENKELNNIELKGKIEHIIVESQVDIKISEGTKIKKIEVNNNSIGTKIDIQKSSVIEEMIFYAPTEVTGKGKIKKISIKSKGVKVEQKEATDESYTEEIPDVPHYTPDQNPPTGYSVMIDQSEIIPSNMTALSFTFSGAEIGAIYNYTIFDDSGADIKGSGTIETASDQITGIDVSGLNDGTLTLEIYLTDIAGNSGNKVTATVKKNVNPPCGYDVNINQSHINNDNKNQLSFTFAGAEINDIYYYSIDDKNDGTLSITGSGPITVLNQTLSGIDVSSLDDGLLILTVYLVDSSGNQGSNIIKTVKKDTIIPNGYDININQNNINNNQKEMDFTFDTAELGTIYNYIISSNGGGENIIGSGTITLDSQQITGIDVSGLNDGILTLTVTLTDEAGNEGINVTKTIEKDTMKPSNYGININEDYINISNQTIMSFTISKAEVGTVYNYSIDDTDVDTPAVTNSGNVTLPNETISGIDVSSLNDDNLTLTVYLSDTVGNQGEDVIDSVSKDTIEPSGYSVSIDQSTIDSYYNTPLSFKINGGDIGGTFNYTITSDGGGNEVSGNGNITTDVEQITGIDVSSLNDGVLTLSVIIIDEASNKGTASINTVSKINSQPNLMVTECDITGINGTYTFNGIKCDLHGFNVEEQNRESYIKGDYLIIWAYYEGYGWAWEIQKQDDIIYYNINTNPSNSIRPPIDGWVYIVTDNVDNDMRVIEN
ncbi:S-layer homology domain-containing protein [Vallitalea guaymasensis]|uniref:S-layer homology domain-containing protein n=1 Tax=Vallitalea guaymasensis TaxID=1185412 RepID=UPI002352605C|nr:S-layer homology domain-containing protein [Vallitalea guaymasensis]